MGIIDKDKVMKDYFGTDDGYKEPRIEKCPECDGTGKVNDTDDPNDKQEIPCYKCEGSGYVDVSDEEYQERMRDRQVDNDED